MLTVRDLLGDLEVRLLAGEEGLELPVRWVHISELLDPTPWLSGGEVLLTTGLQLDGRRAPARVRHEARRPPARRARLRHRVRARLGAGGDSRGRCRAPVPSVRGSLRGAVHRDHRGGVLASGQRAVRGAPPRAGGAGATRADRPFRARARGARRRAFHVDRGSGHGVRSARGAARAACVPQAARRHDARVASVRAARAGAPARRPHVHAELRRRRTGAGAAGRGGRRRRRPRIGRRRRVGRVGFPVGRLGFGLGARRIRPRPRRVRPRGRPGERRRAQRLRRSSALPRHGWWRSRTVGR